MVLDNLQGILVFLVFILAVEMFPMQLSTVCWKCTHRKTVGDKIKIRPIPKSALIWYHLPLACVCMSYKNFFKKFAWTKPLAIVSVICMIPRFILFLPFMSTLVARVTFFGYLYIYSVPLLLLGLVLFHALHVAVYFKIMKLFRFGTVQYIILFVAPYFSAALLKSSIPLQLFKDKEALSTRFEENYKTHKKKKRKVSANASKPTKRRSTGNR